LVLVAELIMLKLVASFENQKWAGGQKLVDFGEK
jgi:hypothetical protein